MPIIPNEENLVKSDSKEAIYGYFNNESENIFTTKIIDKVNSKIVAYPYSYSTREETVKTKKIKILELRGWHSLQSVPNDFIRNNDVIAMRSRRLRYFLSFLYPKFPLIEKFITGPTAKNRITKKSFSINWSSLERILKDISREKYYFDSSRKYRIHNGISRISSQFKSKEREIRGGQLKYFLGKYTDYSRLNEDDYEALGDILDSLPKERIKITNNFIKTKERINIAFLENIIHEFEKLMSNYPDSEKRWQDYLDKYAWILENLFPYKVYLRKREAYVGGKTFENIDGRVVDFLMKNGFDDNYALVEIKTPKKQLLKKTPYRKPDVYAMSDDLSGGINQCLDQKNTFLLDFGKEMKLLDPKVILIIGRKSDLNSTQKKCFELLRANQANVDIVTFDELALKLKGLLKILKR